MSGSETGSEEIGLQHRGGSESFHSGGRRADEGVVATRAVCIENKRFYMDVKENARGRFIKISELSPEGRRNQIVLAMPIAAHFQRVLKHMISEYAYLEPLNTERLILGELSSEVIHSDEKRYRVDLKENARGRFLKVSETFVQGKSRFQIAIPADGMAEFDEHLSDLIEEHGDLDEQTVEVAHQQAPLPSTTSSSSRAISIDNKTYTFDCRKNPHGGRYIAICEFRGIFKSNIQIPESGWDSFREVLNEYAQECQETQ
ncbi:transcriptional regulator protein Pur-beta [Lepeophtheirus salmonis]|uniref:Transcriptional activator protein Pur-beta n=2 Tax=Lepeophtheirus salmonis TaxID=72036 RepID=C1BVN0_LEPSM|nr:transcriptional activator protein Pur-beta-like [Lepeophtheirus salmonis]ACO13083.1 Transcriptional activator protein Pur-beta [Lepeophtheirus salmonis]ADD38783.1 Transcriptional activator protein Pur-beta [Lepeophtheirus salmonis]